MLQTKDVILSVILLLAVTIAVDVFSKDLDEDNQYSGRASTPTHKNDIILYPVIPGTRTPDLRGDRQIIRDGMIYDAIPGTNTPNYNKPQGYIDGSK
jgi:hypothetical protein